MLTNTFKRSFSSSFLKSSSLWPSFLGGPALHQETNPSDYVNYNKRNTVLKLIDRDEKGRFALRLANKHRMNHNTMKYTFEFPDQTWILGLQPTGTIALHADWNGKEATRYYTPVSPLNTLGQMTLLVKTYRPSNEYPKGGDFSQYLEDHLKIGDEIKMSDPESNFNYLGHGQFAINNRLLKPKKHLGLLAGGSGITPIISLATSVVMSGDDMDLTLIFSNKTKRDIFCVDELNSIKSMNPDRFRIYYHLSEHNKKTMGHFDGLTGKMSMDMLTSVAFPPPNEDTLIYICGRDEYHDKIKKFLSENRYRQNEHFN